MGVVCNAEAAYHTDSRCEKELSKSFVFDAHALLNTSTRFLRSFSVKYSILLTRHVVVVDEESFHFLDKLFSKIVNVFDEGEFVIVLLDCNETIIAFFLLSVPLFTFNDSDQPALNHATL
jgi:hypothetical protein